MYVAVGDIHIESDLPYGSKRLWDEVVEAWKEILKHAWEKQARQMIIAGDFLNNISASPDEMRALNTMMGLASSHGIMTIYLISGNHELDSIGDSIVKVMSDIGSGLWPDIVTPTFDSALNYKAIYEKTTDHGLFLVDYQSDVGDFGRIVQGASGLLSAVPAKRRILVAHQPVKGGKLKSVRSAKGIPSSWFKKSGVIGKNFGLCVFGDFHRSQPLPYNKGFYTGSIVMQDFRDEGARPCCHFIDPKTFEVEKVNLNVPTFHTLTITEDPPGMAKLTATSKPRKNSYIKFVLTGSKDFVKKTKDDKLIERLSDDLKDKLKPKMIFLATPQITEKIVRTPKVKRSVSDEELIQQIVDKCDENIPDKLLYKRGTKFIEQARKRRK